jgi:hypothetical protein
VGVARKVCRSILTRLPRWHPDFAPPQKLQLHRLRHPGQTQYRPDKAGTPYKILVLGGASDFRFFENLSDVVVGCCLHVVEVRNPTPPW